MIYGKPLQRATFAWRFVLTKLSGAPTFVQCVTGVTGLTPTVVVYRPDGTVFTNTVYATEIGDGLYTYTQLSEDVLVPGVYRATATTTSTAVDQAILTDYAIIEEDPAVISTGQLGYQYG
jgi:hypothetical protein